MKWMMTMVLLAAPAWAQNEPVHRLVTLKYADPYAAQSLLKNFGVSIQADRQMKVLALSGQKSAVETAESALKQLDVPGAGHKDVDLTVYFVVGRDDAPTAGAIPADLQSTVAALKQTFPYKNYELMDALSLRSRAGGNASTTGQISSGWLSHFSVNSVNVEGEGSMVRIDGLNAGLRTLQNLGQKTEYVQVSGVNTQTVDVKEGQ
jgi:type II secretory pathway component GspD/PulD (secretin)